MQDHRVIALDEWFPARRRRLSAQKDLTRRHHASCAERRPVENAADYDLTRLARRRDQHEELRVRMNAA